MNQRNDENTQKGGNARMAPVGAIGILLLLGILRGAVAEEQPDLDKLVGQPAELSAWAYAYRADLKVQEKPEACFVLRRLERLDQAYRPVSLLLSQGNTKKAAAVAEDGRRLAVAFEEKVGERGACCRRRAEF